MSFLAELSPVVTEELLATAHEEEIVPGQNVYRELPQPRFAFVALLVEGLLRTYVTSPHGRRMAVRYVRPGDVIGLTAMLIEGAPAGADVLARGSMLRLDPITLRRLAQSDAAVGWAIANELARELADYSRIRNANLFGSVRVRVARHLVELMSEHNGEWSTRITQQELADSVGSVREVVARVLVGLRDDGVVVRKGAQLILLDKARLDQLAAGELED